MKKAYIFLAEGFEEMEATAPLDLLRRAGVDAQWVSITGHLLVKGSHGGMVQADLLFDQADLSSADALILPGGMPGTTHLMEHSGLKEALSIFYEKGKWVCAICAAPMIFGAMGIVQGRQAVIYPGMESHLKGASVPAQEVVVDGNVITSKAPGTAVAFALAIVEALAGAQIAEQIKAEIVYRA